MDTKSLYDWANDAGLNFKDEDGYHDAVDVWVQGAMGEPEHLMDGWVDWLYEDEAAIKEMLTSFGKAHYDLEKMSTCRGWSLGLHSAYASSLVMHQQNVCRAMHKPILAGLTKYVTDNAQEWWGDVCSYHFDMLEGQYEDYKYEQARDRALEERE